MHKVTSEKWKKYLIKCLIYCIILLLQLLYQKPMLLLYYNERLMAFHKVLMTIVWQ